MTEAGPTCLFCRGAIDAEEDVIAVDHDGERETSLADEPDLVVRQQTLLVHAGCAPVNWREHASSA
ncbi:MAG: hypothetical protein ACJ764_10180 [Solirubrobacteraceae bacterium]